MDAFKAQMDARAPPGSTTRQDDQTVARIGPNAITRMAEAACAAFGQSQVDQLFGAAGLSHHLDHPPEDMVAEQDVVQLHAAFSTTLGAEAAIRIAKDGGLRTGDYLLANRIPKPAQRVLKLLPSRLASTILLKAISRNAWTFVGSAELTLKPGRPVHVKLVGGPLASCAEARQSLIAYYAAVFQRLYADLVNPDTNTHVLLCGPEKCAFAIDWGSAAHSTGSVEFDGNEHARAADYRPNNGSSDRGHLTTHSLGRPGTARIC